MAHVLADSEIVQRERLAFELAMGLLLGLGLFPAQPTGLRSAPGPPECAWLSRALSRLFYGFPRRGAATRNARRRARPQALFPNATHWSRRLPPLVLSVRALLG